MPHAYSKVKRKQMDTRHNITHTYINRKAIMMIILHAMRLCVTIFLFPSSSSRFTSKIRHLELVCKSLSSDEKEFASSSEYDDSEAESQFGTKEYWESTYNGLGDFPMEEYSWYYGFETMKPMITRYLPLPLKQMKTSSHLTDTISSSIGTIKVLVPGVGNDRTLLDLFHFGYKDLTAFDYCESAIERQQDLLMYNREAQEKVKLLVRDARSLDEDWTDLYDVIIEKGALDAVYLSGKGNVEKAISEFARVIKPGGYVMSISGVLPEQLRNNAFCQDNWEWTRDGGSDLKAGCFVFRRK